MLAGAARVEITPEYAVELAGYFGRQQPATGVHDPVFVRAIVLDNEAGSPVPETNSELAGPRTRAAIVIFDLCELAQSSAERIRQRLATAFDLPPEGVMICCTHTHSAPSAYPFRGGGRPDARFLADLADKAERCVSRACAALEPARFGVATGTLHIAHNRRANLRTTRQPISSLAQPIDDQPYDPAHQMLVIRDDRDEPVAVLLSHSCHPVCFGGESRLISGDYCGLACQQLEDLLGGKAVVAFLCGAAGDINPRPEFRTGHDGAVAAARAMCRETERLLALIDCRPSDRLGSAFAVKPLPTGDDADGCRVRLEALQAQMDGLAESPEQQARTRLLAVQRDHFAELYAMVQAGRYPESLPAVVQRLRLGPIELVALSGEVFVEIGQMIQDASGRDQLWVIGCSNGGFGYVPTREAFAEGGYEPEESCWFYGQPALAPGAGERLAEAAVELVHGG